MCLRLFRNFVQSKIPGKRSKRTLKPSHSNEEMSTAPPKTTASSDESSSYLGTPDLNVLNHIQPRVTNPGVMRKVQGDEKSTLPNASNPEMASPVTLTHVVSPTPATRTEGGAGEETLLEALPPIAIHDSEDIGVDPSKPSYFLALPVELKLEILDQFQRDYTIPSGGGAYQTFTRYISQNCESIKALKALRLCGREMRSLALQRLFVVANLTPHGKRAPNWLSLFEKHILPIAAQHIKYITVYLDDESDLMMARILNQLPNVKWLMLDLNLQSAALLSIEVLRSYTSVTRLTTISSGPLPRSHIEMNVQLLQAYGRNLKSLDLFKDWNHDPDESLLRTIRDCVPTLEHIYLYGTAETCLASILVEQPAWASRTTLKSAHFEACKEVDAWIVASLVELYPALLDVNICSCGGPGDYGNANGRDEERAAIMKKLKPIRRRPLESLRVVHATDVEFRHMCSIPAKKLIIYDPLDQMSLGELLSQQSYFPGMQTLELQYVKEPDPDKDDAFISIRDAVEKRGGCQLIDSRKSTRRLF